MKLNCPTIDTNTLYMCTNGTNIISTLKFVAGDVSGINFSNTCGING